MVGKHSVTNKLRDCARLVLKHQQKDSEIKHLADCFVAKKANVVLESVQELCGCDSTTGKVKVVGMPAPMSCIIFECAEKLIDDVFTR